jgi:zinc protease
MQLPVLSSRAFAARPSVARDKREKIFALPLTAIALAMFHASALAAAPIRVPVTKLTLKNGLAVILHEDRSVPRVYIGIRYGVGSSRETPGRTGFAHLFEHLMFEGSKNVPEGKFDQWLEAAGGSNNAYTSEDETFYYAEVPSSSAELPLFLESDRMGFFVDQLNPDLVDGQRDIVKNERRQSYENRPWGKASLLLPAVLWPPGHPYSWPVIGSMDDLTAASLDDVKSFFSRWYAPSNAILVVVGDFETAQMKQSIEKWFADVPPRGTVEKPKPAPHALRGEKRLVVEDPIAPLPKLTIAWPTVELFHADDALLDLAASVLTQGAGSRLTKRLVHELQIAQQVQAHQSSMERAGQFEIDVIPHPDVKLSRVLDIVDEELEKIAREGIRDDELQRARNQVEMSVADALDSLSRKAQRLASYEAFLGQPDSFERDLVRYRTATGPAVVDVIRRRLGRGRVVMSVVPAGRLDLAVINPSTRAKKGGAR